MSTPINITMPNPTLLLFSRLATQLAVMGTVVPLLTNCAAPVIVAGAAYGGMVFNERRSAQIILDDETIEWQARALLAQHPSIYHYSNIDITSYNREVLLTGDTQSAHARQQFAELVSRLPKVQRVYNEVRTGTVRSAAQATLDGELVSRIQLEIGMINLPGFDAQRVKVVTHDATIFLMGLVTEQEGDAVVERIRRLPGVKRVIRVFHYVDV